jgi:P2-related tail formation protein
MHKKKHTQTNACNKYIIDAKNVLKNNKRKLKERMHTHCKQKTAAKSHKTPGNCFVFTYRFFKVLVFKKNTEKTTTYQLQKKYIHCKQTAHKLHTNFSATL